MKTLILGAGKMVEAILKGLMQETDLSEYYLYTPSKKSAQELAKKVGCQFVLSLDDISDPEWLWIGCKPQQLEEVATSIQGKYPQASIVSMLAALDEKEQCRILQRKKLIRIMPNLPVQFKEGVTLITSLSAPEKILEVDQLFKKIGYSQILDESEFEELTLLTGSGPALFYEFSQYLAQSFKSLTDSQREILVRRVLVGSGKSVKNNQENLAELINHVTSKKGVTISVLTQWREDQLDKVIKRGLEAGLERTREIKGQFHRS